MIQIEYLPIVLTGIGIIASILYYASVLRNQNTTRQAQMFMGIYNQMNKADWIDAWRAVMNIQWNNYEDYIKSSEDPEVSRHLWVLGMFWEGLGVLVKNNLVPIHLVAETMTAFTRMWWEKHIPIIEEARLEFSMPRFFSETEYLYRELMKYLEQHPKLKT